MNQETKKLIETYGVNVAALVLNQNGQHIRHLIRKYNLNMPSTAQVNQAVADLIRKEIAE